MSQRNVELVVGRLLTDETFRLRFCKDPGAVVVQLAAEGIHLTCVEMEALSRIRPDMATEFADCLDPRIQKADTGGEKP